MLNWATAREKETWCVFQGKCAMLFCTTVACMSTKMKSRADQTRQCRCLDIHSKDPWYYIYGRLHQFECMRCRLLNRWFCSIDICQTVWLSVVRAGNYLPDDAAELTIPCMMLYIVNVGFCELVTVCRVSWQLFTGWCRWADYTMYDVVHCQCRVLRAGDFRQQQVAWPFKIVCSLETDIKVHYFGAVSESDMKVLSQTTLR